MSLYCNLKINTLIGVHEATRDDYPTIQKIAHQTWPDTFRKILSMEQISYMLEMMYSLPSLKEQAEKKGHRFLIAEDETGYSGFASYETNYQKETGTKIHKIYILPTAQGKGIGKFLMTKISEFAQQQNNSFLSLNVNKDNPAIQFYINLGFKKVGEENIPIGNNFLMEDIIMKKDLPVDNSG